MHHLSSFFAHIAFPQDVGTYPFELTIDLTVCTRAYTIYHLELQLLSFLLWR